VTQEGKKLKMGGDSFIDHDDPDMMPGTQYMMGSTDGVTRTVNRDDQLTNIKISYNPQTEGG